MKLTDGRKTINIKLIEESLSGYTEDWSLDFFEAGSLPMVDDYVYIVEDVDYCIDYAMDWKNCTGDFSDQEPRMERYVFVEEIALVVDYDSFRVSAGWESGCTIDNDIIHEIGADAVEAELKDAREWFDGFFEHKPDYYLISYYRDGENIRDEEIR